MSVVGHEKKMNTGQRCLDMIAFWTRRIKETFIQEAMLDEKEATNSLV